MKQPLLNCLAIIVSVCIARCAASEEPLIANRKYRPWSDEIKSASESKVIMEPITSSNEKAPRFSIGLGTLSPSYSQKFGADGRTRLDVNNDKNGYSYSLSNIQHPSAASTTSIDTNAKDSDRSDNKGYNPNHYYQPGQPQFSIFQSQGTNTPQPFYNQLPVVYGNVPNGQYPLHPLASGVNYNNAPFYPSINFQNNDNQNNKQQSSNGDIKSSAQQQSPTSTQPNNLGQNGVGYGQQPYGYPLMNPVLDEYVRSYQMLQQAASVYPTAVSPFSGQQPFGQQSQIANNYGYPYLNGGASGAGVGGFGSSQMSAAASNPLLAMIALASATSPSTGLGYGGAGGFGGGGGGGFGGSGGFGGAGGFGGSGGMGGFPFFG